MIEMKDLVWDQCLIEVVRMKLLEARRRLTRLLSA
jgi:hypothetical protein